MKIFIAIDIVIDGTKEDSRRLAMLHGSMLFKMQDVLDQRISSVRPRGQLFARWRRVFAAFDVQFPDQTVWRFVDSESRFVTERTTVCIHC